MKLVVEKHVTKSYQQINILLLLFNNYLTNSHSYILHFQMVNNENQVYSFQRYHSFEMHIDFEKLSYLRQLFFFPQNDTYNVLLLLKYNYYFLNLNFDPKHHSFLLRLILKSKFKYHFCDFQIFTYYYNISHNADRKKSTTINIMDYLSLHNTLAFFEEDI